MNRSMPGLPVHHQLPESTQTHVHWVGDAIQPSHPWSSPSPPAPNPSQHQRFFQWVSSLHEVAKNIGVSALASFLPKNTQDRSPSEWTGWISLQSKGLSRVFSSTTFKCICSSLLSLKFQTTLRAISSPSSASACKRIQAWFNTSQLYVKCHSFMSSINRHLLQVYSVPASRFWGFGVNKMKPTAHRQGSSYLSCMKVLFFHMYIWFPLLPLVFGWTILSLQAHAYLSLLPPQSCFWCFPHQLITLHLMSRVPCSSHFIAFIACRVLRWYVYRQWAPWGQRSWPSFTCLFFSLFILWGAEHVPDARVCSGSLQTSSHPVLTDLIPQGRQAKITHLQIPRL